MRTIMMSPQSLPGNGNGTSRADANSSVADLPVSTGSCAGGV
jgi:hypothetical protein